MIDRGASSSRYGSATDAWMEQTERAQNVDLPERACSSCPASVANWSAHSCAQSCDICCSRVGESAKAEAIAHMKQHRDVIALGEGCIVRGAIRYLASLHDEAMRDDAPCVLTLSSDTRAVLDSLPPMDVTMLETLAPVWWKAVLHPVPAPPDIVLSLNLSKTDERQAFLTGAYLSHSARLGAPQFTLDVHSGDESLEEPWERGISHARMVDAFQAGAQPMIVEGECSRDVSASSLSPIAQP